MCIESVSLLNRRKLEPFRFLLRLLRRCVASLIQDRGAPVAPSRFLHLLLLEIVVALSLEALLIDGGDEVRTVVVVLRALRVNAVLAHDDLGGRSISRVELQQVLEELASSQVCAVLVVLEDPLRVDDLLTLVNESAPHLE